MWSDSVYGLKDVLPKVPRGVDGDVRGGLITLWRLLNDAPVGIRQLYNNLSEQSIMQAADAAGDLGAPDFGFRPPPGLDDKELVRHLAVSIRALEGLLVEQASEARPARPEKEWRVDVEGASFYLVPFPRLKPAPAPKSDYRPFTRRGVKAFRILPCKIGGYQVKLASLDVTGDREEFKFGAALFRSIDFKTTTEAESFLVTSLSGDTLLEQIDDHVRKANADECAGAVFPELTINPEGRNLIRDLLHKKPWTDDKPDEEWPSPDFIVAGSWHEPQPGTPGKFANVATVFDGDGTELLRHTKIMPFQGGDRRMERIELGKSITVLVARQVLYAFGICLDFAQKSGEGPYGGLDVDFIVITSCGNDKTMASHIDNAKTTEIRYSTRPFIVQQAYPELPYPELDKEGLGFVLHPKMDLDHVTVGDCVADQGWSVVATRPEEL